LIFSSYNIKDYLLLSSLIKSKALIISFSKDDFVVSSSDISFPFEAVDSRSLYAALVMLSALL